MRKLTILISLLLVVAFAYSQNNTSQVYQDGDFNIATVKQIGVDNWAYLDMLGNYNIIWQCQTGHGNTELFFINNGDWNATYPGVMWMPWHYCQFGVQKFFICQLWDPSNTQHQYGHFNWAETYIDNSNGNLVSQTQGWKYHPFMSAPGTVVGNFNEAYISIAGGSDNNLVMQAQLLDENYAVAEIYNESDWNASLQFQFGYWNSSEVLIEDYSDYNWVATCQYGACNTAWVDILMESDFNEVIINQYDCGNFAQVYIDNYSNNNDVAIHQENPWGWGNWAEVFIYDDADYNQMSICQWDFGGHEAVIDIYMGDFNKIYTYWDGFFCVPMVFGDKVYTELFWDWEFNVIRQEGENHNAEIIIHQTGSCWYEQADFNKVSIYQWGPWSFNNTASIWIYNGSYNRVGIAQTGYWNTAWIDVMWNSNWNIAGISQWADNNFAYILQINGSDCNMANIVQGDSYWDDGYNQAFITQNYHDWGIAIINQFWAFNYAEIVQEFGMGNQATIYQKTFDSYAYIYETGIYNFAAICQHYFGYHYASIHIFGNYNGFNNAIWPTTPYFVPSNPGYHGFFKVDNWVFFDPTNMIHQEGKCNVAAMWIVGDYNRSSIFQTGYPCGCGGCGCVNNEAYLDILNGDWNITAQYQEGAYNYSHILIEDADCGKALTFQVGVANDAFIHQYDGFGNMAGIDQFGHCHSGIISQTGFTNEATINQFDWNPHGN